MDEETFFSVSPRPLYLSIFLTVTRMHANPSHLLTYLACYLNGLEVQRPGTCGLSSGLRQIILKQLVKFQTTLF